MTLEDELAILRRRMDAPATPMARPIEGCPAYLGKTYDGGNYPTTVPRMFLTHPVSAMASESEGAVPTIIEDATQTVPVLVQGGQVPPPGSLLVARLTQGLWIAYQRREPSGPVPPPCGCGSSAPTTVHLTISSYGTNPSPSGCVGGAGAVYSNLTFTWSPAPVGLPSFGVTSGMALWVMAPSGYTYFLVCVSATVGGVTTYSWVLYRWISFLGYEELYRWAGSGFGANTCTPFYYETGTVTKASCVNGDPSSSIVCILTE
ncbi:hypothetical protein EP7_005643 (plasmid) [Isosphaeraceae bacterium EP7]